MTRSEGLSPVELHEDKVRSIARVTICGVNQPVRNRICNLTYEVICGEGIMAVEGDLYELRPGTVVEVAAGQAYQDAGEVSFIVTARPPFSLEQVEAAEPQLPLSQSYLLQ